MTTDTIELAKQCGAAEIVDTDLYECFVGEIFFKNLNELESFRQACIKEAVQWQPIETAPKDGTRFLAIVDGDVRVVAYTKTRHVPIYGFCLMPIYGFCLIDQGAEDCDTCRPTHWMPLPAAPEMK